MAKQDKINIENYTSTTAKIVAQRGNVIAADIMELSDAACERLHGMTDEVRGQYWALHARIEKQEFDGYSEQLDALEKLAQLAIAMKQLDKARKAFNTVRCFS